MAASRRVEVSNPDKVLFPADGLTKADLVAYYRAVGEVMVRHVRDRPVTLQRFPNGIDAKGFYQKDASDHFPEWLRRADVPKVGGRVKYPLVDDVEGLAYLANQGTIVFHIWLSRLDRPDRPDRLVFDLDPSGPDFALVVDVARAVRATLDELGLVSYVAATGSRGLHVTVPLDRSATGDEVRAFAGGVARLVEARDDRTTTAFRKADRHERLYLDIARNGVAQTVVAPYSVRARRGAPVAVPLEWAELDDPDLRPDGFTLREVPDRVAVIGDPWEAIGKHGRSLRRPAERLEGLLGEPIAG
jgi:bifunctional non-homologous end joining protein LigD